MRTLAMLLLLTMILPGLAQVVAAETDGTTPKEEHSSGEFSQLWLNYRPIDVGEDPNWEELIIVRDDTLFVAGEWVNHATKSTNPLGERESLGIALMEFLGDETDNAVRSELARAWLEEHAAHLYNNIEVLRPGVLLVTCPEDLQRSRMRVGYYETVEHDALANLKNRRLFIINHLQRGGWVVLIRNGGAEYIPPQLVPRQMDLLRKIRSGCSDDEIDSWIHPDWVKILREEVRHENN